MRDRDEDPPFGLTTVGVTGTNGKTTTTTLIGAALGALGAPVASVTTVGFFLGRPNGVTKLDDVDASHDGFLEVMRRARAAGATHAAVEYTSEALSDRWQYWKRWPAQVAVFTNLSHDHLDPTYVHGGSAEHYLASKAQLFLHLPPDGTAILNGCDEVAPLLGEVVPPGVRIVHYGVSTRGAPVVDLDVFAKDVHVAWEGTRMTVEGALVGRAIELRTRAIGAVHAENALAALCAAIVCGVAPLDAADAIAHAAPPAGRFEVIGRAPWVVVDYAHSPDALARTLGDARALCRGVLTVVFGAGGNRDRDKRPAMGRAAAIADRVILTSDNPREEDPAVIAAQIADGLVDHHDVQIVLDRAKAIERAIRAATNDDVVLIAGKGHETEQIVGTEKRVFSDRDVVRSLLEADR